MVTYLFGGSATWIAIGMLLLIGVTLTLAPVIYTALEGIESVKVILVGLFIVVAIGFAITADAWAELRPPSPRRSSPPSWASR